MALLYVPEAIVTRRRIPAVARVPESEDRYATGATLGYYAMEREYTLKRTPTG
jgi:hypothetical protein